MAIHKLLAYQSRWVQDGSTLKVIEKSRRIGLSWCEAYDSVLYAGRRQNGGTVYYQSYALDMTRGFIADCADWAERLSVPIEAVGETLIEPGGDLAHRLRMASGHEILALTSAPRALRSRGKPGDRVVLDEAAFVDDLPEVLKAAMAFRVWGGGVRVISTHNGEGSAFARLVRDVRDGLQPASLHTITFRAAIAGGLYRRICEVAQTPWSPDAERAWEAQIRAQYGVAGEEELDCIPRAAGGAWLAWDLIRRAERPPEMLARAGVGPILGRAGEGPVWIGVDVARRNDLWVLVVLQREHGALHLREIVTESGITFSAQTALVEAAIARWRPVRVAIDQTGMGEMFVEELRRRLGPVIEGVLLTAPRRLDVATALRRTFEDGAILIPADDWLRRDLHAIRQQPGATGAPRLVADRAGTDGHADRFWALALAVAAAAEAPRRYAYEPVRAAPRRAARGDWDWDDDVPPGRFDAYAAGRAAAGGLW